MYFRTVAKSGLPERLDSEADSAGESGNKNISANSASHD
jgi:hypothetical protein